MNKIHGLLRSTSVTAEEDPALVEEEDEEGGDL